MTTTRAETPAAGEAQLPAALAWLHRPFVKATLGAGTFALMVLFFVYFFDEFDTAAFSVLAPQIKDAFHLSNQGFIGVIAANLSIVLIAGIPVGYYGDRLPRRLVVVVGAVIAGIFSFATGLAPTLLALVLFRIGNGIGVTVNSSIHPSLLSDYYQLSARPTVFALHNNAQRYGLVFGPMVAGLVAFLASWRIAFVILIVPILIMATLAMRLPKVARGQSDDAEAALVVEEERPLPFGRAVRVLLATKTLRRQYAAWVAIGAAYLPLITYGPILLHDNYHLNELQIGIIGAFQALLALIGVEMAGRYTRRKLASGLDQGLKIGGQALAAVGPPVLLIGLTHNLAVALIGIAISNFVGGWFWPGFLTTQAVVSPARVRSLSYSFGQLFLVVGLLVFDIIFGQITNHNVQNGYIAVVPFWLIGGGILWTASRFVQPDAERAFSILAGAAELRRQRLESSSRSILSVRKVDVSYGPVQVLFGVDLDLEEGEIIALLGTNGAGKSTLLRAISGILPLDGGAIFFDGEDITGLEPEDSFQLGLVQVPGGKGVFPGMTVKDNLDVAAWASRRSKSELDAARQEVLEMFPSLQRRYEQPAAVLSGGERQMLTLAQAFLSQPKLLMIDELSLGLAPIVVEELLKIVRRIHADGASVILVEQSVNVALTVATRAVFMEKGEVRFSGPTAELLQRDDILRAVFLSGAASLEGANS